jgi:hypothetical protein
VSAFHAAASPLIYRERVTVSTGDFMSFHDGSSQLPGDGQQIHIQSDGMVRFGSDNQTNVHFYKRPVADPELSRQYGRPMTKGVDYVRIQHPGERDTIDTPVANKPDAPHRWPRQWAQFQRSQEQIPDGTPIEMLFPQHPEIGANLHAYGIHTIEQMANLSEHAAQSIGMGATQWRNKAKDFLEKANTGVGIHKLEAELEKRDNVIEVMKNQLDEQKRQIDRLIAAQQGVPGAMIPAGRPTVAQAHAASVRQAAPVDWTQPIEQQPLQQLVEPYNQALAGSDWTQQASGYAAPQPTPIAPRPRGRPRKLPATAPEATPTDDGLHHPLDPPSSTDGDE